MATYQVNPPEPFTFSRPEEWPRWYRQYERFSTASGLDSKDDKMRVNTLVYTMGDEATPIVLHDRRGAFEVRQSPRKVRGSFR